MNNTIQLGQYIPTHSIIHALDPRVKLLCSIMYAACAFTIHTGGQLVFHALALIAVIHLSRITKDELLRCITPLFGIVALVAITNIFLMQDGTRLWSWGIFSITQEGLQNAGIFSLRLVYALIVGNMLLMCTTQMQLADALDSLLSPLARLGFPAHEIAMVFSLMLRFIPVLASDARAISEAQRLRSTQVTRTTLRTRLALLMPLVIALLSCSYRHAQGLGRALDARCYRAHAKRNPWHPLVLTRRDYVACGIFIAILASSCALGIAGI